MRTLCPCGLVHDGVGDEVVPAAAVREVDLQEFHWPPFDLADKLSISRPRATALREPPRASTTTPTACTSSSSGRKAQRYSDNAWAACGTPSPDRTWMRFWRSHGPALARCHTPPCSQARLCRCDGSEGVLALMVVRHLAVVGGRCDANYVELTARVIEEIPRGNLRVPRSEFLAVWAEAERLCEEQRKRRTSGNNWYAVGVANACRWLAGATVTFNYPHGPKARPAPAPVTRREARAHEELIEAELLAVERMALRHPDGIVDEPGWLEAVEATLKWVWRGSGVPPLEIRHADAG